MHHAERWDPSVREEGRVNRVLMSKLCHLEKSSSVSIQSRSKSEFIQRTLQLSIFVWKPFLCSRCISFEILISASASCAFSELEEDHGVGS